jgi:hypothetical protein
MRPHSKTRLSAVERLPAKIREAVDAAIRDDRATIDEIVMLIRDMGGTTSRSAVGRYVKRAHEQMARYRRAQALARVWMGKDKEKGETSADVAQLLAAMLKTLAFQVSAEMGQPEAQTTPREVAQMAKALVDIGVFEQLDAARERLIRDEAVVKAAEAATSAAASAGLPPEAIEKIRREIYGLAGSPEPQPSSAPRAAAHDPAGDSTRGANRGRGHA